MVILHADRLLLRKFRIEDFDDYAAICADPLVAKYIGDGKTLSRADAWRNMAVLLGHWQLLGYGMWAVEERASGKFIGRIGFHNPEGWPGFEIGWILARSHWGQGLATEGARAALKHAFTEMKRPHVISLIRPGNQASIRVAEKLGERLEGSVEVAGIEALVYGIRLEDWSRRPLTTNH